MVSTSFCVFPVFSNFLFEIIVDTEFKSELDGSTLFDFSTLTSESDLEFYNDYLYPTILSFGVIIFVTSRRTLSSSPTSMFDPVNTLAEVDKIYEQWEQERAPEVDPNQM